jgi:hypothetical protein
MMFARDLAAGTVLSDSSLVLCAVRATGDRVKTDVIRPCPPYGELATIDYGTAEWVEVRTAPHIFGGAVAAAPAHHLSVPGMIAAADTLPAELAAQIRGWETGHDLLVKADRMPDDLIAELTTQACRWIDATAWPDRDPQQPAAARMTAHEAIACIRQHYPLGGWVGFLRDQGVLAPRDTPKGKKQRDHFDTWDKRGIDPRTGQVL